MKRFLILITSIALLFAVSCGEDSADENFINYDGDPASSPILPSGNYETAVYFPGNIMDDHIGKKVKNIWIYIFTPSLTLNIDISEGSSASQPGSSLYTRPYVGTVRGNNWNIHTLAEDFVIDGSPLWVRVQFSHTDTQQTIGCDEGPSVSGGAWLYQSDDQQWRTFQDRSGESINWNIRLELE